MADLVAVTGAPGLSVRRISLDEILVNAAADAGAEVRLQTAVTGLVMCRAQTISPRSSTCDSISPMRLVCAPRQSIQSMLSRGDPSVAPKSCFICGEMTPPQPEITLHYAGEVDRLSALEPLWNALQEHHSKLTPNLGGSAPNRELADSWRRRRVKYEGWLKDPATFFVVAEDGDRPVGYAFVTVGPGYAGWQTGDRLAELETLSVMPEHRGDGVGSALLQAVWGRLAEMGVEDLVITTAKTNVDSHRFYERHGFIESFVIYYGKGDWRSNDASPRAGSGLGG